MGHDKVKQVNSSVASTFRAQSSLKFFLNTKIHNLTHPTLSHSNFNLRHL